MISISTHKSLSNPSSDSTAENIYASKANLAKGFYDGVLIFNKVDQVCISKNISPYDGFGSVYVLG